MAEYIELAEAENDSAIFEEILPEIPALKEKVDDLELLKMFSGDDDDSDAILTIHPGAGGTESTDWAQMLYRMFHRWIERKGFEGQDLDYQPGEEAGIKSAVIEIKGSYAFGFLKAETGVHRLVRISPFDSGARRHTSFASVYASPVIADDVEFELDEKDIRVDTYRASGAGGQHVNKTDSAIRMTHMPTGIVVQCQNERSQLKNREICSKILKSRLYQHHKEEEDKKRQAGMAEKKKIEWGSQIRSYVLHPYNMVKDHRTNVETSNTQAVLDGEIDEFIKAYLLES